MPKKIKAVLQISMFVHNLRKLHVPACRVNAKTHMQKIKKSVVVIQFFLHESANMMYCTTKTNKQANKKSKIIIIYIQSSIKEH